MVYFVKVQWSSYSNHKSDNFKRFLNGLLKNEILSRLNHEKYRLEEFLLGHYRKETNW